MNTYVHISVYCEHNLLNIYDIKKFSNKCCARTNEIHFVPDTLFHKLYRF